MIDKEDCVQLGLTCATVCHALGRGIGERQADQLSQTVVETIEQLLT